MPPATRQLDQVSGCGSGTALVTARVMLLIDRLPFSTLHDFDADPVGRRDIAQETPADALLQFDWEVDALRAQPGAEGGEVTLVQKPEMIGAPFIVAGVIGVGPDRPCRRGILARALAADQDRHATQFDKDLRRAARDSIAGNRRAEHLDIPSRRGMRVLADYVDVIELECRIAHPFAPIGGPAAARAGILPSAGYNDHHNASRPRRRSRGRRDPIDPWRMKVGSGTPASPNRWNRRSIDPVGRDTWELFFGHTGSRSD